MKQAPYLLWLNKAEKDLRSAEKELASDAPITETICFHSQQAVEKYIKAYLVKNKKDFKRIHNIRRLIEIACEIDEAFKNLEYAIKLSIYAVEVRYPDDFYEPTIGEAKASVEIAQRVKEFIKKKI